MNKIIKFLMTAVVYILAAIFLSAVFYGITMIVSGVWKI